MRRQAGREKRGVGRVFATMEELETRTMLTAVAMTVTTRTTYIELDPSGQNIQIYAGSSPTGTPTVLPTDSVSSISVAPSSGNDALIIDYSNGDPVPAGGISFTGAGSSLGNTLRVIGASPADAFVLTSGQVQHGTGTVTYSNVLNLTVSTGNATATSDLQMLGVTVGSRASLTATAAQHIGQLTVSNGGTATLQTLFGAEIVNGTLQFTPNDADTGTSSLNNLLLAGSMDNWSGRVDLTNDKLIVETTAGNKAALLATLQNEGAYGTTHAAGIMSSQLPANMVLVVVDAAKTGLTSFGGVPIDSNSILIGPELLGDANLDGAVDLSDLSIVENNFGTATTSWTSGNFDNSGTIDLTDLSEALNNFGATTSTTTSAATSATTGTSAVVATGTGSVASKTSKGASAALTSRSATTAAKHSQVKPAPPVQHKSVRPTPRGRR